ncbi:MAG: IPT/TIG domain-containing protein, partial [Acidimicrobiales bacterium]
MTFLRDSVGLARIHGLTAHTGGAPSLANPGRAAGSWQPRLSRLAVALVSFIAGVAMLTAPAAASSQPTVTAVDASIGTTAGGDTVDVVGTNLSVASAVDFGTTAATSFTVDSATQLTAVTPAHSAAIVDVTVTTGGGTSPTSSADQFSYLPVTPTAYVADYQGAGTVTPIQTATNTAGSPITVGHYPIAIAITPNGSTAYVVNDGGNTVTPVTIATGVASSTIAVGSFPNAIAITPDGSTAYVSNDNSNSVTPINTAANTHGTAIAVGSEPIAIAITPNGSTAYVVNNGNNTVTPINTATNTHGTAIAVGSSPVAIAITPNGSTAYVVNYGGTITPINTATNIAGSPITVGVNPRSIAITPDGSTAYVSYDNNPGTVTPINIATGAVGSTIEAGDNAIAVAISYVEPQFAVTGVAPDSGATAGGTAVTITGTGFIGATAANI